jgi:hypothetical protein
MQYHSHSSTAIIAIFVLTLSKYATKIWFPEKEQKQTKMSGHLPDLKIFSGTNVLMIKDSV